MFGTGTFSYDKAFCFWTHKIGASSAVTDRTRCSVSIRRLRIEEKRSGQQLWCFFFSYTTTCDARNVFIYGLRRRRSRVSFGPFLFANDARRGGADGRDASKDALPEIKNIISTSSPHDGVRAWNVASPIARCRQSCAVPRTDWTRVSKIVWKLVFLARSGHTYTVWRRFYVDSVRATM